MSSFNIGANRAYFTSDLHFGHAKMASLRGFDTTDQMDKWLTSMWNVNVAQDDVVFVLGDVSFRGSASTIELLNGLKGRKILIRGNHDKGMSRGVLDCFSEVHDMLTVKVKYSEEDVQRIVCCHYPMLSWDMAHYGTWMLHGHSHGTCKYPWDDAKIMDVGVDTPAGALGPIPYWKLSQTMDLRNNRTGDYHEEDA